MENLGWMLVIPHSVYFPKPSTSSFGCLNFDYLPSSHYSLSSANHLLQIDHHSLSPSKMEKHNCRYSFWYGDVSPSDSLLGSDLQPQSCKRTKNSSGVPTTPTLMPKSVQINFLKSIFNLKSSENSCPFIPGAVVLFIGR
jgi:hypothetical protein